MINKPNSKLSSTYVLLMITLLSASSVFGTQMKTDKPSHTSSNEDHYSLPKLENEATRRVVEVSNDLKQKAEELKDSFKDKGSEIKEQLIQPAVRPYKLEERNYSDIQHYSFQDDIRPILNKKCLACHACYDAPCQLKMETGRGLERGASKIKIYDGARLNNLSPTRLAVDYQHTVGWREHGFYPVINGYQKKNKQSISALMLKMLDLARENPLPINQVIPENIELGLTRQNSCSAPDEFEGYAEDNPHGGMPLAMTGLTNNEYTTLSTWLREGAKIEPDTLKLDDQQQILVGRWEAWLNRKDKRSQLVSRYLYEHLFLAHLYLDDVGIAESSEKKLVFFKLIRSSTPPGELPIPVKTTRPNDAVIGKFFYRLQLITDTLVNKTHIVYAFGEQRLNDYQQKFFTSDWSVNKLPGYSEAQRGNPFETFSAIPAKIRYQFLLDDAAFFVRNFIRGPVCRGQIATDVIRDQFWVMFESPEYERYTNNEIYQDKVNPLLGVPGQNVSLTAFGSQWLHYHGNRNRYIDERQKEYKLSFPEGAQYSHIWNGDKVNQNAFQTIFRHHDSASIVKGWKGAIPQTAWILDYPLFERTIYELVVGFNVFGNVSHQAQTRLYFDLIRNEGETNFLRFIPAKMRGSMYRNWYAGSGKIATLVEYHKLDTKTRTAINFISNKPYTELLEQLMAWYPELTQAKDAINRCDKSCDDHQNHPVLSKINQALRQLTSGSVKTTPGIQWLPDVSFLRIDLSDDKYLVYSLIRNRMHSNVAFMLGESLRFEKSLDTLTILPDLVGSYPNLLFQVDIIDLDEFTVTLANSAIEHDFEKVISQWGVRRMNPNFWEIFHDFSQYMEQYKPLEAGIYDLNRYGRY